MYEHVVKAMDRRRSKQTKKKTKELKHVHANEWSKETQKLDIALYEEWRNIETHCYNEQVKNRQNWITLLQMNKVKW